MESESVFLCTENTQVFQAKQELPGQILTDLTVNKTETMKSKPLLVNKAKQW